MRRGRTWDQLMIGRDAINLTFSTNLGAKLRGSSRQDIGLKRGERSFGSQTTPYAKRVHRARRQA
jgi:hypothetical protein